MNKESAAKGVAHALKEYLQNHGGTSGDRSGYLEHMRRLACNTLEALDEMYNEYKDMWSLQFVDYANTFLHHDLRNHAIGAVMNRFSVFKDDPQLTTKARA